MINNMMSNFELLPVGSVIKVKNKNFPLMIVGFLPNDENNVYDYLCVKFPSGINKDEGHLKLKKDYFYVNDTDIETTLFMGYLNKEFYLYKECFIELKSKFIINNGKIKNDDIKDIIDNISNRIKGDVRDEK